MAPTLGFEPRQAVLETVVLPLHHVDILVLGRGLEPLVTFRFLLVRQALSQLS